MICYVARYLDENVKHEQLTSVFTRSRCPFRYLTRGNAPFKHDFSEIRFRQSIVSRRLFHEIT